jgi:15-cis-phytoene synthase
MSAAVQPATGFSPSASQIAVAYSVCRGITRKAAKNFYYAFLILPKAKHRALCAVYAFMRRCDDLADDESLPPAERRQKLSAWLGSVHNALAGHPTDEPVLLALTDAQRRFGIPVGLLDELAYGTAMDLDEPDESVQGSRVRYATFEDLRLYCHRVASVVGLVCIRIFGYSDPAAEPLAERCGLAFQLTNIIRDVKEDALAGRVYLPEEDLARFSISSSELAAATDAARYAPVLAIEADRAREYYQHSEALIPMIEEDSQPALWVLIAIYRALLEKIAARGYDVFHGKIRLTVREKLTILGRGLIQRIT